MVSVSPLNGVIPLINGLNGLQIGVTSWMIIPVSKWLITMVSISPLNGVILHYKWLKWRGNRGYYNLTGMVLQVTTF